MNSSAASVVTKKTPPEKTTFSDALRILFSSRNFPVFLITGWVMYAFNNITSYFNLYLRALGWSFILIGLISTTASLLRSGSRLIGGFVGDVYDRKILSVAAMAVIGFSWLLLGITESVLFVFVASFGFSLSSIFKSGSSAYLYDSMPKEHRGLGNSLFVSAGPIWGIPLLYLLALWTQTISLVSLMHTLFLMGGVFILFCAVARWVTLTEEMSRPESYLKGRPRPNWSDFISENLRALRLVNTVLPGLFVIGILDVMSDHMFSYGALIYANEYLGVSFSGISILLLAVIVIQLPLGIIIGRKLDISADGRQKSAILIYSLVPLSVFLLLIAPVMPYLPFIPSDWIAGLDSMFPGASVLVSTVFIGVVGKMVTDTLWLAVLFTVISTNLESCDRGKATSVYFFVVTLVGSAAPTIAGLLFDVTGPSVMFLTMIGLNILLIGTIVRSGFGKHHESASSGDVSPILEEPDSQ